MGLYAGYTLKTIRNKVSKLQLNYQTTKFFEKYDLNKVFMEFIIIIQVVVISTFEDNLIIASTTGLLALKNLKDNKSKFKTINI